MEIRTHRSCLNCDSIITSTVQYGGKKLDLVTQQRYAVMADALNEFGEEASELLSLPRVQVTVNVAQQQLMEFNSRSDLVEATLPVVLDKVQEIATATSTRVGSTPRSSTTRNNHVEEETYHLELKPDMSLRVASPKTKQEFSSLSSLSPEKTGSSYAKLKRLQPSPVRKLVLGSTAESEDEEEEEEFGQDKEVAESRELARWRITAVKKLSEMNVVCVVNAASTKNIVLNILFNVLQPASPTTGLRMPPSNALLAQMSLAKSGFALLPMEGGLLSVGGYTREGVLAQTEFYDIHFNCWDDGADLNTNRARFAAVECRGTPYIIGGSDGKVELGSIEAYNKKTLCWEKVPTRMVTPRSCFSAATIDGKIYAVGGIYYYTHLKSAEVYDPSLQKWKLLPSMHTSRYGLCVAACCGKIYAIGGQTLGWNCLATAECYDPKTSSWCKVASMKTPRRNAASVSVNGKIYVIGGYNGSSAVNLVEVYDPRENVWTCLPPMCMKRSSASAVHLNGSIFVAGGYSGSLFLNSIERYDIKKNEWFSRV